MDKPKKHIIDTSRGNREFYYTDEINAYIISLLEPLKEVWEKYKNDKYLSIEKMYEEKKAIKQLAERLDW